MQAVASRVAEEMGVKLGEEVGYTIRFEDVTDAVGFLLSYLGLLFIGSSVKCCILHFSSHFDE